MPTHPVGDTLDGARGPFDRRVDALDSHIETLGKRMGQVEQGMERFRSWSESMTELVRDIKRSQDRLEEKQSNSGRINYGWVAASVSVGLLIASTVGGLALEPVDAALRRHDEELRRQGESLVGTITTRFTNSDGEQLEQRIADQLDSETERLESEINRVRDKLANHMSNGHPQAVIDKVELISKVLDETREEMRELGRQSRE